MNEEKIQAINTMLQSVGVAKIELLYMKEILIEKLRDVMSSTSSKLIAATHKNETVTIDAIKDELRVFIQKDSHDYPMYTEVDLDSLSVMEVIEIVQSALINLRKKYE